jgi:hypothetical protein
LSFKLFQAALEQVSNSLHHHTKLLLKKKEQLSTGVKNTSTGQSFIFIYFGHTIRVSHEVNPTLSHTGNDMHSLLAIGEDKIFLIYCLLEKICIL